MGCCGQGVLLAFDRQRLRNFFQNSQNSALGGVLLGDPGPILKTDYANPHTKSGHLFN
jgi:hypothetical protein